MRKKLYIALSIIWMMIYSTQASANAGIPMIMLVEPILWLTFIPIVLIEGYILVKSIPTIRFKETIFPLIASNAFSTLIGIPVTWFALVCLQMLVGGGGMFAVAQPWQFLLNITVQSPWMLPDRYLDLLVPLASMVLFIPFFFISVISERFINARMLKNLDKKVVYKATFKAHLGSYALLYSVAIGFLLFNLATRALA